MRSSQFQTIRQGTRTPLVRPCRYEITEMRGGSPLMLHEGYGLSVNVSEDGMLLLLPQPARTEQVFEVEDPSTAGPPGETRVVEVRWTREVAIDGEGSLYLAGVQFLLESGAAPLNGFDH